MIIPIIKDWYDDRVDLYNKDEVEINPNVVTILVGCNGSGKSTLLRQINNHLKESEDIKIINYNNLHQGGNNALQSLLNKGNLSALATGAMSSEGENIHQNIGRIFGTLREIILNNKVSKLFMLFDAIDSGLDIANIDEIVIAFKEAVIPEVINMGMDIYIIISTNSYEFCIDNDCISMDTLSHIEINSYDEFKQIILDSDERKNKRYEKINNIVERKRNR